MISEKPFVSVIILSFNGQDYLFDCLDSVLKVNYPIDRFEVIVADNCSSDRSVDLIRENFGEQVKLIEFEKNFGFSEGNNLALRSAKGELIIFLNQDTVVNELFIQGLVNAVEESNFDACQSNIIMPRNDDFELNQDKASMPKKTYFYQLNRYGYVSQASVNNDESNFESNFLSGCSFIIRRDVLNKLGEPFNLSTVVRMFGFIGSWGEDIYLSRLLKVNGFRIGVSSTSVTYHFSGFHWTINRFNFFKNIVMTRNRYLVISIFSEDFYQFIKSFPFVFISQSHKIYSRLKKSGKSKMLSTLISLVGVPISIISFLYFLYFRLNPKNNIRISQEDT